MRYICACTTQSNGIAFSTAETYIGVRCSCVRGPRGCFQGKLRTCIEVTDRDILDVCIYEYVSYYVYKCFRFHEVRIYTSRFGYNPTTDSFFFFFTTSRQSVIRIVLRFPAFYQQLLTHINIYTYSYIIYVM